MIQLVNENQSMKLIYFIGYLIYLKLLQNSLVEGKINISIVNAYLNISSPKWLKINKFELTSNKRLFIEADILQEITSFYVSGDNLSFEIIFQLFFFLSSMLMYSLKKMVI